MPADDPCPGYQRDNCRLCAAGDLVRVIDIPPTPPANELVTKKELTKKQHHYPLDVYLCVACGHLQLGYVVPGDILFRDYLYLTGASPVEEHFRNYAKSLVVHCHLQEEALVIDIGSNDGSLLRHFQNLRCKVLGIEPAVNIAQMANAAGIETCCAFISTALANEIVSSRGKADLVVANNVFAHVDDILDFTKAVQIMLKDEGIFVFEVSYLLDVYEKTLFDTIYHEHLDYHALHPLQAFFARLSMEIIEVERITAHGGSIRVYVGNQQAGHRVSDNVKKLIAAEHAAELFSVETYRSFNNRIETLGRQLREQIAELRRLGKRVVGYTIPAKATTLIYKFGLSSDEIAFIVDDNHLKQHRYSPGHHIPILPTSVIDNYSDTALLILAWNFAEQLIEKLQDFLRQGGTIIVPLPTLRVITSECQ